MKIRVSGMLRFSGKPQKFSRELQCQSEKMARELTYADLGSRHGLKRGQIKIEKVERIQDEKKEKARKGAEGKHA